MRIVLVTIGDEVLRGDVIDTNAAWLGERLFELGHVVTARITVGDDTEDIVRTLIEIGARADVAIVGGGLGPTDDDRTAEAVAHAARVDRVMHEPSLFKIRERFEKLGFELTPNNLRQAMLPDGAEPIPNHRGTAPGFTIQIGGCRCHFLPGIPSEMRAMFDEFVAPGLVGEKLFSRMLHTFGITESRIDHDLRGLETEQVKIHFQTRFPENRIKLVARDQAELSWVEAEVRARLGSRIYGVDGDTIARVVGSELRAKGATLAIAESFTGGLIGHLITETPGASEVLRGAILAYANDAKESLLHVPPEALRRHGAVSTETAYAMARGVRTAFGADYGVATTGIAGPAGGSAEKPVGTMHLAVAGADGGLVRHRLYPGPRDRIKVLGAWGALALLLRVLRGETDEGDAKKGS